MITRTVKVFNAKLVDLKDPEQNKYYAVELAKSNKLNIFDFHNQILNSKNKLSHSFTPMIQHIEERQIYSLTPIEENIYKMNNNTIKQCKDLLDSQQRKQHRYEQLLIQQIEPKNINYYIDGICPLSPIKQHIYDTTQQPYVCICCKERKQDND